MNNPVKCCRLEVLITTHNGCHFILHKSYPLDRNVNYILIVRFLTHTCIFSIHNLYQLHIILQGMKLCKYYFINVDGFNIGNCPP